MKTVIFNESFLGCMKETVLLLWDALSNDYPLYEKKVLTDKSFVFMR